MRHAVNADAPALIADLCAQHNARLIHSTDFVLTEEATSLICPMLNPHRWGFMARQSGRARRLSSSAVLAAPY